MTFTESSMGSVTIWYNPDAAFIRNIHSYSSYSSLVVIVDNSLNSNRNLFDKIEHDNKIYIWQGENLGIARALNKGISLLMKNGFDFALTLDQDSSFEKREIENLVFAALALDWGDVGILAPIHVQQKSAKTYNLKDYTPALCVMTSGNILNLEIAEKIGFFNEQLFIDHVDNDYCLRLNVKSYKVLVANSFLNHELGTYKDIYVFGKRVGGFISHSPERLYYFVRNSLYILKKYYSVNFKYTLMECTALLKRFTKLFVEGDTSKRLKLYFKGIIDHNKLS